MSFQEAKLKVEQFKHRNEAKLEAQHDELLHLSNPYIRTKAITAMMKYEQHSEEIKKLLKDHNPSVRKMAVKYFMKNGSSDDVELILPLLDDPIETVVIEAIHACFWLSRDEDEALSLIRFIHHKSPAVRLATLKTAKELITTDQMIDLTKDPDKKVKEMASQILVERSSDVKDLMEVVEQNTKMDLTKIALKKLIQSKPKYSSMKLEELMNNTDYAATQRSKLICLIKEFPFDIAASIIDNQVEKLKDEVIIPRVLLRYVKNNEDAVNRVFNTLKSFLEHKNPAVRVAAIKGFAKMNVAAGSLEVRKYIFDSDEKVRAAAVNALAKILDFHLTEHISELIKDHSKQVRIAVVKAIGRMKIEDFYDLITNIVCSKREDESVWKVAIEVSSRLKLDEVVPTLQRVIQDDHEEFSILNKTAESLLRISPEAVLEILVPQEKIA